jgi:hypothetical protein
LAHSLNDRLPHHCLQIYNRAVESEIKPATILRHAYGEETFGISSAKRDLHSSGQSAIVRLIVTDCFALGRSQALVIRSYYYYHHKEYKRSNQDYREQKLLHLTPPLLQSVLGKLTVVLSNLDRGLSESAIFSATARVSPACARWRSGSLRVFTFSLGHLRV